MKNQRNLRKFFEIFFRILSTPEASTESGYRKVKNRLTLKHGTIKRGTPCRGVFSYIETGVLMSTQDVLNEIVTFKDGTSMRFGEMTIEDHERKIDELNELID